ncbi:unnamed protein product [Malus baccata var. baccata]
MDPLRLICIFSSLPSTRPFGSSSASGSVGTPKLSEKGARAFLGWVTHLEVLAWSRLKVDNMVLRESRAQDVYEAFWELTGFGFCMNSEVKRERGQSIPRMGDPLGSSSHVSSHKQNLEGVVGAQSGQYRATGESSLGCGVSPGRDVTSSPSTLTQVEKLSLNL